MYSVSWVLDGWVGLPVIQLESLVFRNCLWFVEMLGERAEWWSGRKG